MAYRRSYRKGRYGKRRSSGSRNGRGVKRFKRGGSSRSQRRYYVSRGGSRL